MKEYRITIRKQLDALTFLFYVTIFIFLLLAYYKFNNELDRELMSYYLIFFFTSFIPVAFLHIEYILRNTNCIFEINKYDRCLKFANTKEKKEAIINFLEIEQIIIYCAPSVRYKRTFKILPFENYHFARIITKSSEKYIITSLLMEDILDAFKVIQDIKIKYKVRIFATTLF